MNITTQQLFAMLGEQAVELLLLRQENAALRAQLEELLALHPPVADPPVDSAV